jgi:hypothetical protein
MLTGDVGLLIGARHSAKNWRRVSFWPKTISPATWRRAEAGGKFDHQRQPSRTGRFKHGLPARITSTPFF